jgi:hypothetical protein
MTSEQKKDNERLRRYIEREQLYPVMNETKWRETMKAMQSIEGFTARRLRVKCLRDPEPPTTHWHVDFPNDFPYPFGAIAPLLESRASTLLEWANDQSLWEKEDI